MEKTVRANRMIAAALLVFLLAGCGSTEETAGTTGTAEETTTDVTAEENADAATNGTSLTPSAEEVERYQDLSYDGDITVLVPQSAVDLVQKEADAFLAAIPGLSGVTVTVSAMSETDAAHAMLQDPSTADLYVTTQDYLPQLVSSGAAAALPDDAAARVQTSEDERTARAATVTDADGNSSVSAFPLSFDGGSLLYYDSSVINDPSSLSAILTDCESAGKTFDVLLTGGWYQASFFLATGAKLTYSTDADGTFTLADSSMATDVGVTALRAMCEVADSSAFENNFAAGNAENAAAIIDGYWDAPVAQEKFGDHYACAKLPSFTGSDGQTYQMSGFSSCRLLCVVPTDDSERQAVLFALADDLTGTSAQLSYYNELLYGPADRALQWSQQVQGDEALTALQEQQQFNVMEGRYPGDFWQLAATLGDAVLNKEVNTNSSDEDLLSLLTWFEDTCSSYTGN